jgi:glycine receptor alpha-3
VHDQSRHCKGGSRENTITKYNNSHGSNHLGNRFPKRFDDDTACPPPPAPAPRLIPQSVVTPKDINKMFGITASDIDKYSRVIFPITFICFQLMYWIIYQHLSDTLVEDLVFLQKD